MAAALHDIVCECSCIVRIKNSLASEVDPSVMLVLGNPRCWSPSNDAFVQGQMLALGMQETLGLMSAG